MPVKPACLKGCEYKMKRVRNEIIKLLPLLAAGITLVFHLSMADSDLQPEAQGGYFTKLLLLAAGIYVLVYAAAFSSDWLNQKLRYKAPFITGVILFICVLNIVTLKLALLPVIFFPSLDLILETVVDDRARLLECIIYSLKLLLTGFFFGALAGFLTGLLLGFNARAGYWLNPVLKVLGPIPTTAWIPLALTSFPTTYQADVFLIAFAVWFPITLMTSSGIQSTPNTYFEVSRTLGASKLYQVVRVGIPNAMPSIFLGIFYGTCSSFITLMTVEIIGGSCGIGWYVNWQKQMMVYKGVYAGLIIIALLCSTILTVLFHCRDKVLVWQKGVIKW